jgi:hypothetical protein
MVWRIFRGAEVLNSILTACDMRAGNALSDIYFRLFNARISDGVKKNARIAY